MKLKEHLDITDINSINSILNNKSCYSWNAIDSEYLDNWVPDIGLSSYPNPSIYLPDNASNSLLYPTIKHRFWGTVEKQSDHKGKRFIGVLLFASVNDDLTFELKLGSKFVGRVKPIKYDNQRHLIICKESIVFNGEMEVFQFTAVGKSNFRIEKFLLINELPKEKNILPSIKNIKINHINTNKSFYLFNISFYSSSVCKIIITCNCGQYEYVKKLPFSRIHNFNLKIKNSTKSILFEALIIDEYSNQNKTNFKHVIKDYKKIIESKLNIPLEVCNKNIFNKNAKLGIPIKKGFLHKNDQLKFKQGRLENLIQYRILSFWNDGSAKWILAHFHLFNNYNTNIKIIKSKTEKINKFLVKNKKHNNFLINHPNFKLKLINNESLVYINHNNKIIDPFLEVIITLSNNKKFKSKKVENIKLIDNGPSYCQLIFDIKHFYKEREHFKSTFIVSCYKNSKFINIKHNFEITTEYLPNVSFDNINDNIFYDSILSNNDEENLIVLFKSIEIIIPIKNTNNIITNDDELLKKDNFNILQSDDRKYSFKNGSVIKNIKGQFDGNLICYNNFEKHKINIIDFWQNYPKGIKLDKNKLSIGVLPSGINKNKLNFDKDEIHRNKFWLNHGLYHIKLGMRIRTEFQYQCDSEESINMINDGIFLEKPIIKVPLNYLNKTNSLRKIGEPDKNLFSNYENLMNKAIKSFNDEQSELRTYGHLNYGDWYGESGYSWGNNEYDTVLCSFIQFLRDSDYKWYNWGFNAANHLVNIDTINNYYDESKVGSQSMHMPGHTGGYLPPYFKSKMKGTQSIPSHTWVEGPILGYLLTGEQTFFESLGKTKKWLLNPNTINYYDYSNAREAGWHLIHLCAFYENFNDVDCLNGAHIIAEKVMNKKKPNSGWIRMLTESHCGCGFPRCSGEAGFMLNLLLSGLYRYYLIAKNKKIKNAIIDGVNWLIDNTFDPISNHFRYTSCLNRTLGGNFQKTQEVIECIAFGYNLSKCRKIKHFLDISNNSVGLYPNNLDHLGLGKALAQQMRYVPFIMPILKNMYNKQN